MYQMNLFIPEGFESEVLKEIARGVENDDKNILVTLLDKEDGNVRVYIDRITAHILIDGIEDYLNNEFDLGELTFEGLLEETDDECEIYLTLGTVDE